MLPTVVAVDWPSFEPDSLLLFLWFPFRCAQRDSLTCDDVVIIFLFFSSLVALGCVLFDSGILSSLSRIFFSSPAAAGEREDCLRTLAHGADIFLYQSSTLSRESSPSRCNYPSLRGAFLVWIYVFCYANLQKHREQNFVCVCNLRLLSLSRKGEKKMKLSFLPKRAPREPSS